MVRNTTASLTLSLHDALPICPGRNTRRRRLLIDRRRYLVRQTHGEHRALARLAGGGNLACHHFAEMLANRSEEHTSELQSRGHLVCRLLLEKKKSKSLFSVPL